MYSCTSSYLFRACSAIQLEFTDKLYLICLSNLPTYMYESYLALNCPIMRGHIKPNLLMSSFVIYTTVLAFICQDYTH